MSGRRADRIRPALSPSALGVRGTLASRSPPQHFTGLPRPALATDAYDVNKHSCSLMKQIRELVDILTYAKNFVKIFFKLLE